MVINKMSNTKKRVLWIEADRSACGIFRVMQPLRALQRMAKPDDQITHHLYSDEMDNDTSSQILINYINTFDALILQRPASPKLVEILRAVKLNGKTKIYIELDDALFHVHPSNPASKVWTRGTPSWNALIDCIDIADKLILSTPELAQAYKQKESVIFYNGIDSKLDIYSGKNNRRSELPLDKTIIGWAGSTSHVDTLKGLIKPIKKLAKQRNDFIFALCSNPEFLDWFDIPKEQKVYIKHRPIAEFPPVMSLFDINIAVVKNDFFNSGKSELKVLEAGIWGKPSICTYAAPYTRFNKISDGGNFLVADNDPESWCKKVSKMIDDKKLYQEMAEKTRKTIETVYDLEVINQKRTEFFKSELL